MTLYLYRTLDDGSTIIRGEGTAFEQPLKAGQWEVVSQLANEKQLDKMAEYEEINKADPNPRTEVDEQAIETAQNASSGEAHEQAEEAK